MTISVTASAAQHIQQTLRKRGGAGLRVGVKKAGCSGFAYTLDYADAIDDKEDAVFEQHGVKVIVNKESLGYLNGAEIDYVKQGLNAFFKFNNPNAQNTCGCGESFSV